MAFMFMFSFLVVVEDDESVKLYEKINEKWKQMFDECYKVVTTVMERCCVDFI